MALKSQDPSANQSTGNRPLARKDPEEEKELTESQKRKAQLLEKRKKYDPRKALKTKPSAKKETEETTDTKVSEPEPATKNVEKIQEPLPKKKIIEPAEEKPKQIEKKPPVQSPEESKTPDKSDAKASKPFLKRKTHNLKGGKLNWNVQSRTDCWSGPPKATDKKE